MPLPDKDSYDSFGGTKIDAIEIQDSASERSADEVNPALCDVAMATRTVDRGWVRFTLTNPPVLATPTSYEFVWKGNTSTQPALGRTGTGVYTVTVPATVNDEMGDSHTVNFQIARGNIEGSTPGFILCTVTASNVITVRVFNASGSASDLSGATVGVFMK